MLPADLAQLLTGQLGLLWQAAVKQADADTLAAREQADADIAQADRERDEALAKVTALESELAVLREVVAERDRLLEDVRELRDEALPLREQVAPSDGNRRTPGGAAEGNEGGAEGDPGRKPHPAGGTADAGTAAKKGKGDNVITPEVRPGFHTCLNRSPARLITGADVQIVPGGTLTPGQMTHGIL